MSRHPHRTLELLALVGVGGFAGANLRYAISLVAPDVFATLVVNTVGSFVLGLLLYEAAGRNLFARESRILLGTGFLASFTTYSTFAVQTAAIDPVLMIGNIAANYGLGFAGVFAGRAFATSELFDYAGGDT